MSDKKVPERTCIACRKKFPQSEMMRVSLDKEGNIRFDEKKRNNGRGAYICKNKECMQKCIKSKALNRAYKTNVPEKVYDEIKSKVEK